MNNYKCIKLSIIITNIFLIVLFFFAIALPWLVTWYVETMKRSATLAATVMVTCYPCVPFAAACLLLTRKLLKNALAKKLFSENSTLCLRRLSACCIVISAITLIAGKFYLPFLIVGAAFAFISLLTFSLKCIFSEVQTMEIDR